MRCVTTRGGRVYRCPCGETFRAHAAEPEELQVWVADHRPHTDGTCVEVLPDGGAYTREL